MSLGGVAWSAYLVCGQQPGDGVLVEEDGPVHHRVVRIQVPATHTARSNQL